MNDFVLTHAVAWRRRIFLQFTRDVGEFAICHLETGKWQIKRLRDSKWKCSYIWRQFGQIQNGTVLITAWEFQWVAC